MFKTVIDEIKGMWDVKEITNSLALWGYFALLTLPFMLSWYGNKNIRFWYGGVEKFYYNHKEVSILIVIELFLLFVFSLSSFTTLIIRVYEGYLLPGFVKKPLEALQKYFFSKLKNQAEKDEDAYWSLINTFPLKEKHLMPTRLGNILKAAELYSWDRYNLDSVFFWPRLFILLSKERTDNINTSKGDMVFLLLFSFFSYLFSVVFLIVWTVNFNISCIVLSLIGLPLGYIFYWLSCLSAYRYGGIVKSYIDVYRRQLLDAMGAKTPKNLLEEQETWKKLHNLLISQNCENKQDIFLGKSKKNALELTLNTKE